MIRAANKAMKGIVHSSYATGFRGATSHRWLHDDSNNHVPIRKLDDDTTPKPADIDGKSSKTQDPKTHVPIQGIDSPSGGKQSDTDDKTKEGTCSDHTPSDSKQNRP
ncbi:hypothetical protein EON65_30625 [archaeon]|nr:MAG: hypothetical protein EON65_30625 [archaeon]